MRIRILHFCLLFCFIAPLSVTYLHLHYQKKQIRREVKAKLIAGLDKDELTLLKFHKNEVGEKLTWKDDHEFVYKGEMYDIVSTKIEGDSIYFDCWWDNEETLLNHKLNNLAAIAFSKNIDHQNAQNQFNDFLKSLVIVHIPAFNFHVPGHSAEFSYVNKWKNIDSSSEFQPPQLV